MHCTSNVKRVAVLSPVNIDAQGQVLRAFKESANYLMGDQVAIYPYFSRGLKKHNIIMCLRQILHQGDFDLLVTIGQNCTYFTRKLFEENNIVLPHLFLGASKELVGQSRLVSSLVGISYERSSVKKSTQFLLECKPHIKDVVIPVEYFKHDQRNSWLIREVNEIKKIFAAAFVNVAVVERPSGKLLRDYLNEHIKEYDTIMLLQGTFGHYLHQVFGNGRTLFSGILELVKYGSSLGYGSDFGHLGHKGAYYLQKMLFKELPEQCMSVHLDDCSEAAANLALAANQELDPSHIVAMCHKWQAKMYKSATINPVVYDL